MKGICPVLMLSCRGARSELPTSYCANLSVPDTKIQQVQVTTQHRHAVVELQPSRFEMQLGPVCCSQLRSDTFLLDRLPHC